MKPNVIRALVAGALLASSSLPGRATGVSGPAAGFVLDGRSHTIRPINGIPGASVLGGPLSVPFSIDKAAIVRDFALVTRSGDGALFLVRGLRDAVPTVVPLDGVIPGVSLFSLSPSGAAAVLYSASPAQIQVVSGLPDKPAVATAVDVSLLPGGITAMALDDSGSRLVAGVHDGGDYAVYGLFPSNGDSSPKLLGRAHDLSAVALLNGGADAVYADRFTNQVFLVHDVAGSADLSILAGEQDGISAPVALQGTNSAVYIADAGSSSLTVVDMVNRGAPASITLPGNPTRCERLDGDSVFVLNEAGSGPLLLLDLTQGSNIFFVPADQAF